MKPLLALCLALVATAASADPFDLTYCTTVTKAGAAFAEGCTTYHASTVAEVQTHNARFAGVLKVAGQVKDTGGPWTVELKATTLDKATGKPTTQNFVNTGLKTQDAARILHAIYKASDKFVSDTEAKK